LKKKMVRWFLENQWQRDGVGMVVLRVEATEEDPLDDAEVKALARDAEDLLNTWSGMKARSGAIERSIV